MARLCNGGCSPAGWLFTLSVALCGCSGPAESSRPPTPGDLRQLDPLLIELVEATVAAVEAAPADAAAWRRLGLVYQGNRLHHLAAEAFARAAERDPSDARAWYGQGTALANIGRADDALAAYERAAALTDYPPLAWRRGLLLLETGRLDAARAAFAQAVEREPDDPAGHAGLARIDLLEGRADAAIERLEPLVSAGAGPAYLHHLLGLAYRQAGRADDAAPALARGRNSVAVFSDPWSDEALAYRRGFDWTLAEARRALADGRPELALPALERLRQLRPQDPDLLATIGSAYAAAGRADAAAEAFRELARFHPDDWRTQYELSRYHDRGERYRQALEHAARAVARNGAQAAAWRQQGLVLLHQERFAECEHAAAQAVELAPGDGEAWRLLGDCRLALERWAAAAAAFERAAAELPDPLPAWLRLAEALARAGDRARARLALDRARALDAERADDLARRLDLATGARE